MYSTQASSLNAYGLSLPNLMASVLYSVLGLLLLVLFLYLFDRIFEFNFRKELLEDQNTALGVLIAGVGIAIAIIIASAIHG